MCLLRTYSSCLRPRLQRFAPLCRHIRRQPSGWSQLPSSLVLWMRLCPQSSPKHCLSCVPYGSAAGSSGVPKRNLSVATRLSARLLLCSKQVVAALQPSPARADRGPSLRAFLWLSLSATTREPSVASLVLTVLGASKVANPHLSDSFVGGKFPLSLSPSPPSFTLFPLSPLLFRLHALACGC